MPKSLFSCTIAIFAAFLVCAAAVRANEAAADEGGATGSSLDAAAGQFVRTYCVACHGGEAPEAEPLLETMVAANSPAADRDDWDRVLRVLGAREMPPEDATQPTDREITAVAGKIRQLLAVAERAVVRDPGRVTIRRLNRSEYKNTIRDLMGMAFEPADTFPVDGVGYGFDNIGDVLSVSPLLMEKYLAAAEKIATTAIVTPESIRDPDHKLPAGELAALPESHTRIIPRRLTWRAGPRPRQQVVKLLRRFASRAFRRPATDDEVARLAKLVTLAEREGDSFERGVQLAVEAVLISPSFLFRGEFDPEPDNPGKVHPIAPYELASRLSYFLWSSMPDERLMAAAKRGTLREQVPVEVRRMLADEKSAAWVENFGDQWLQIRRLDELQPDPDRFPNFDAALRDAMQQETRLFLTAILREDRDLMELIDARFTFLNERLARHYGVPGVEGKRFRRVTLNAGPRGGVLTQASVLTATSNPTRTSPVKRGKWILEQILADPPPPPPPGVQQLPEDQAAVLSGSLRARFEQHRANPSCAICHGRMDPMGFALENFDAIGAWRDRDGAFPIDPSAKLPDGEQIDGPEGLKKILAERRDVLRRCLAEKLLVYALGRGLEPYDRQSVNEITAATAAAGDRLSDLIVAICMSDPFQMRRGEGE